VKEFIGMPQEQRTVNIIFLDGTTGTAIATGNNAAWHCSCGYGWPLIGRTGMLAGATPGTKVECPKCGSSYFVIPEKKN
jgi:hypothetical protein